MQGLERFILANETTNFITASIAYPKRIVDLGAGTGLLSYYWYRRFPKSDYVLVDMADEMLDVAAERFDGIWNVSYKVCDYRQNLPQNDFDCVISALSIHHLGDTEKMQLFERIRHDLPYNGVFVNYDQFSAGYPAIDEWYNEYWIRNLKKSGLTKDDIRLWRQRRKLDKECSVELEMEMLNVCNFREVKCVYSNQKFAVIFAIK